ncbi:hypothetical protein EYF80_018804 [Liparis tanakae]|uniref:Uncharacterized protein n=1 Tax=Liparis tanakae TaxID=230148 RepID=A0A4Z2HZ93_9TELE|nr:hypothetical protein EYF80_018804 [Liparis tanakae]
MAGVTREAPVHSSPAVASHAEGEEIEVLESTDVLPVAPEDQWKSLFDKSTVSDFAHGSSRRAPRTAQTHRALIQGDWECPGACKA